MYKRFLALLALALVLAACTQPQPPAVTVTVSPQPNQTGVAVDTTVTATFSAAMNEATLEDVFTLASPDGEVTGAVAYNVAQRALTFTPTSALDYATEYTASVTRTVRSSAGGALAGPASGVYAWTFTTIDAPVDEGEVVSVTVTPASAELEVGGTVTLVADVDANDGAPETVVWESDNEAVATVADGVVSAVAPGVATITATSTENAAVFGESTITVLAPAVTGVAVTPTTLSFLVGDAPQQLTANVTVVSGADAAVTWSSSDLSVATVDGTGLVTAIAVGTATITAESVFASSVTGTATVNVADAPEVFGVTLDPVTAELEIDENVTLAADVDAVGGAPETVTWESDNEAVATVADGVVSAVAPGVAIITATSTENTAAFAEATITVLAPAVTDVVVTPAEFTLAAGDAPEQLTAAVTAVSGADDAVIWSSDDVNVATVDADGFVTAVSAGTANITATSDFDATVSGSATVNVPGVTGIIVTPPAADLATTNAVQLIVSATFVHGATDDSVTWSSSDVTVASVDASGYVTALAEGSATITATSVMTPAAIGSAEVTVHPAVSTADYVTDAGYLAGDAITLDAPVVTGGLAPFTYTLTGGALPAGVELNGDGTITGAATVSGNFTAEVTVSDDLGQTDTAEVTLAIAAPMVLELYIEDTVVHLTEFTPQSLIVSGGQAPFTFTDELVDPEDAEWADRYADGIWFDHDVADQGDRAPGILFDATTGAISGTATAIGYHRTYIRVTDSLGQTDVAMLEIDVDPAELVLTYDPAVYVYEPGSEFTLTPTVTGGVGTYTFSWDQTNPCRVLIPIVNICLDSSAQWDIDPVTGEIMRESGNSGDAHNSNRTYAVTVTDSATPANSDTFTVTFDPE